MEDSRLLICSEILRLVRPASTSFPVFFGAGTDKPATRMPVTRRDIGPTGPSTMPCHGRR